MWFLVDHQRDRSRLARIGHLPFRVIVLLSTVLTGIAVAVLTALILGAITLVDMVGLPGWSLILLLIPLCLVCWFMLRRSSQRLDER